MSLPHNDENQTINLSALEPTFNIDPSELVEAVEYEDSREADEEEDDFSSLSEELEREFDEALRRRFHASLDVEFVEIAGAVFLPSDILATMDEIAYIEALQRFQEEEEQRFRVSIIEEYPTPIAYHFYHATNQRALPDSRFQSLRDTWESLLSLLFAIVLGEYRRQHLPLPIGKGQDEASVDKRFHALVSSNVSQKLDVVSKLVRLAVENNYDCSFRRFLSQDIIERMRNLHKVRNGYSHTARQSTNQVQDLLAHVAEVIDILRQLDSLTELSILRYIRGTERLTKHIAQIYKGRYLDTRDVELVLDAHQLQNVADIMRQETIIIRDGSLYYEASPWIHFILADEGHSTRLCIYKECEPEAHIYEVIGQSRNISHRDLGYHDIDTHVRDIKRLLKAGG